MSPATRRTSRERPDQTSQESVPIRQPSHTHQWEPLRLRLREHGLQYRLISLRQETEVSASVSLLRVYDVVASMEGRDEPGSVTQEEERDFLTADPPREDFNALDDEDGRNPSGASGDNAD